MRTGAKTLWIAASACLMAGLTLVVAELGTHPATSSSSDIGSAQSPVARPPAPVCEPRPQHSRLAVPLEQPAQLGCEAARKVVAQARRHLVEPPARVDPREFAETVNDWLDPHGLWSAAPDAPVAPLLEHNARRIIAALERGDPTGCESARLIGVRLAEWIAELGSLYDRAFQQALNSPASEPEAWSAASDPVFENGPVQRSGKVLAEMFGRRAGLVATVFGADLKQAMDRARARLLPSLDGAQWGNALLAASVRAYVILIDPHGAWAPVDEESSLYEVELEASGRTRLWQKMTRSAAGLHIEEPLAPPLQSSDLLISIAGIPTAGLSVEQAEQLGILDPNDESPERDLVVLRQGVAQPLSLRVAPPEQVSGDEPPASVSVSSYPFGDGETLVLKIADVPDDLGEEVASLLAEKRSHVRPIGVILDLRGNGGGSTDGARSAIGLFLPGVPLFPMRRRDGSIEIEHATRPTDTDQWDGPVAALVDGATASAAEMVAGALAAYRRGPIVGSRTYGKGCAQEYMDDEVGAGVLRLTTLVYALPDGTPVQRVGLAPTLAIGPETTTERESSFARAPGPWRAPDMRDRAAIRDVPWPAHGGRLGPCAEETVCRAMRALGAMRSASAKGQRSPER
jgi:carboxyl-terminal processing protease